MRVTKWEKNVFGDTVCRGRKADVTESAICVASRKHVAIMMEHVRYLVPNASVKEFAKMNRRIKKAEHAS